MPRQYAFLCLLLLALLVPSAALAHKVTVFAYVDGPNVVVDAFYSKSNKVSQGRITVLDASTGEEYLKASTDEQGALSFPVPAKAVAAGADLRIRLVAGEGHQDDILVKAQEYAHLRSKPEKPAPAKSGQPEKPAVAKLQESPAKPGAQPQALAAPQLDEAALARIVNQAVEQAVESRMAPVKRLLLESAQKGPGMTEIVGGIGYIVGLFGIAAFAASRRKGDK